MTSDSINDENTAPIEVEQSAPVPNDKPTPWVIKDVQFEKSGTHRAHFPKEPVLPEVAFVGRSNVGKSSLLNLLVNRKRLAHVSSTPGRTQLVNFFRVNEDTRLVDLPGYGFAKAPKDVKKHWDKMITNYLLGNRQLRLVVTLFDARRTPNEEDSGLLDWLKHYEMPFLAVITKADKLNRSDQARAKKELSKWLEPWGPVNVILSSSLKRSGRDEILAEIGRMLAQPARTWLSTKEKEELEQLEAEEGAANAPSASAGEQE